MPLQELENKQKIEIIEDLPETKEEPKKRKPEELENPSLWQRFKDKVIRPIKNVVFSLYNRIVLGKNYSNTVAKDYDRARDEGLIDGMFDDGEYTPEDLTSEQLEEEKEVLEDFEREDLGDMFDTPPEEIKIAQKDMTTTLREKIDEFSEKENADKIKLISRSNVLNNEISLEKDDLNNISISFKGKNMHKDFILSPPYEEQDVDKLAQEYQNFFSELKKQREVELEVMKMFEDPKQTKEDTQTKEEKEIEEEKNETQEFVEEKEDVAEIPDFSDDKSQQENDLEPDVAEIPALNTFDDTSLESDSSSQVAEQELDEKDESKNFNIAYEDGKLKLISYRGKDKDVIIPEGPTRISSNAFCENTNLASVMFSNTIKSIGVGAFKGCSNLTKVNISDSVESIEPAAFYYCNKLTNITIGKKVKEIGNSAFDSCKSIENITIPDNVKNIGFGAFANCKFLESITFEGNPTLGEELFTESYNLKEIIVRNEKMKQHLYETGNVPEGCEVKVVNEIIVNLDVSEIPDFNEDEKSSITYIALSKDAFNKCVEKAKDGDKVLAQTKTKDKSLKDIVFEKKDGQDVITIDEVTLSDTKTRNSIDHIVDKNKQKEFKTAVITTVETINTYNEKGDYVVMSDTLTARLSVKEEELTISVETLNGEVKEATIAYPPEKSEVTQTITDLLSQPEQNRTADQPLVVSVADAIIEDKLPDDDSLTDISIGENKTFAEMLEESYSNSNFEYKDGEMVEIEEEQGDDFGL